ncbi:MAG: hypothetical protein R2699_16585 [Acidimicrobiales bacterium]
MAARAMANKASAAWFSNESVRSPARRARSKIWRWKCSIAANTSAASTPGA